MKRLLCLLTALFLFLCAGCAAVDPAEIPSRATKYIERNYYHSPEALADAATHIFEGRIIDMSAVLINQNTGESQTAPIDFDLALASDYRLTTIYKVQVIRGFKGNTGAIEYIELEGGNWDDLIVEQAQILQQAGLYDAAENRYSNFYDISPKRDLDPTKTYLFCVRELPVGNYKAGINENQFAIEKGSEVYDNLIDILPYSPHPALIFAGTSIVVLGAMLLLQRRQKK